MYKFEHLPVSRRETLGNSVNVVNVLIFATDRLRPLQRNESCFFSFPLIMVHLLLCPANLTQGEVLRESWSCCKTRKVET